MNAKDFIIRQLGTVGWAPIDPDMAVFLCPEVAHYRGDFEADKRHSDILPGRFPRTALYRAKVEGFGEVLILSRSSMALAERIHLLTGGKVELVEAKSEAAQPRPQAAKDEGNKPRPCMDCSRITGGGGCGLAAEGKFPERPEHYHPDPAHPRKCQHYQPSRYLIESGDRRTGLELWPELLPQ